MSQQEDEPERKPIIECKEGEIYALDDIKLKCSGDLKFCAKIIEQWMTHTNRLPVLQSRVIIKKSLSPSSHRNAKKH